MKRSKKFVALFAALALSFSMLTTVGFAAFADDDVVDEPAAFSNDDMADEPAVDMDAADEAADEESPESDDEVDGEEEAVEEPVLVAAPAAAPADEVVLAAEETEIEPAAQIVKSVDLTATNPVCGTHVKCPQYMWGNPSEFDPQPPVSVSSSDSKVQIAWWVSGSGTTLNQVFPRVGELDIDGTKWYKFVIGLEPAEGYQFPDEYDYDQSASGTSSVDVSISTGWVRGVYASGTEYLLALVEIPATHDWGEWTVTKEPTTTAPGERVRTCSYCSATETQAIPPIDDSTPATDDSSDSTDGSGSTPAASDGSGSAGGPVDRSTGGSGTVTSQNVVPASSAVAGSVDNGLTTITDEGNPTVSGIDGNVQFGVPVGGVVAHAAIWIAIAAAAVIALFIVFFRRKKSGVDEG